MKPFVASACNSFINRNVHGLNLFVIEKKTFQGTDHGVEKIRSLLDQDNPRLDNNISRTMFENKEYSRSG